MDILGFAEIFALSRKSEFRPGALRIGCMLAGRAARRLRHGDVSGRGMAAAAWRSRP